VVNYPDRIVYILFVPRALARVRSSLYSIHIDFVVQCCSYRGVLCCGNGEAGEGDLKRKSRFQSLEPLDGICDVCLFQKTNRSMNWYYILRYLHMRGYCPIRFYFLF